MRAGIMAWDTEPSMPHTEGIFVTRFADSCEISGPSFRIQAMWAFAVAFRGADTLPLLLKNCLTSSDVYDWKCAGNGSEPSWWNRSKLVAAFEFHHGGSS